MSDLLCTGTSHSRTLNSPATATEKPLMGCHSNAPRWSAAAHPQELA